MTALPAAAARNTAWGDGMWSGVSNARTTSHASRYASAADVGRSPTGNPGARGPRDGGGGVLDDVLAPLELARDSDGRHPRQVPLLQRVQVEVKQANGASGV
jgi:hypothetical protein